MLLKNIIKILIPLIFISCGVRAQLVNVESKRMQNDTMAFAGNVTASYSYKQSNTTTFSLFKAGMTLQTRTKTKKSVFLILGSYDLTKTNTSNINNSGFIHFRYIRKFNNFIRLESFIQYQNNEVLLLDKRTLLGVGPRLKLFNKENLKSSFGVLYMYEIEQTLEDIPQLNRDHRLSSYFTFTYAFPKDLCEVNTITYFQPRLDDFSDFRLTNQTSLYFKIIKNISLSVNINYLYDTKPPKGVISNSFSSTMGVKAGF